MVTLGLMLFGFSSVWRDSRRMPSDAAAYMRIGAAVSARAAPGDVLRHTPVWDDSARMGASELEWSLTSEFDDYDRALFRRVFLIWTDTYQEAGVAELGTLDDVEEIASDSGVHAALGQIPPAGKAPILLDGYRDLDRAEVYRVSPGSDDEARTDVSTPCTQWLDDNEWHCGRRDDFVHVGRVEREMDDQVRRCIYANPPGGSTRWSVRWPAVDGAVQLRLRAGNTLWAQRHHRGSDVHLRALINDEQVAVMSFRPDEPGYPETIIDLSEAQASAELRVEIWADDPLDRFFCFRPQLLGEPEP